MSSWFVRTFDDVHWLKTNEDQLRNLLPSEWFIPEDTFGMRVAFGLKVMGVMWEDFHKDIPKVMARLQMLTIVQMRQLPGADPESLAVQLRRNPNKISEARWVDITARLDNTTDSNERFSLESMKGALAAIFKAYKSSQHQ